MHLIIAVVQRQDAGELIEQLNAQQYRVTRISSEGGFLREGNVTLLIAIEDWQIDAVIQSIRSHCHTRTRFVAPMPPVAESGEFYPATPLEVQVGGATVFVLKAADVQRL